MLQLGSNGKISHSYRALVYMFVKQEETTESVEFLCNALDKVAYSFFAAHLEPGVTLMDHSDGFRNGVKSVFSGSGTYHRNGRVTRCHRGVTNGSRDVTNGSQHVNVGST